MYHHWADYQTLSNLAHCRLYAQEHIQLSAVKHPDGHTSVLFLKGMLMAVVTNGAVLPKPQRWPLALRWPGDSVWSFTQRGETFPAPLLVFFHFRSTFKQQNRFCIKVLHREKDISVSISITRWMCITEDSWPWALITYSTRIHTNLLLLFVKTCYYTLASTMDVLHIIQDSSGYLA